MPKGQEEIARAAMLCRTMVAEIEHLESTPEGRAALVARIASAAEHLEALQGKFFVKMAPSLRYTGACLAAAVEAKAALVPSGPIEPLADKLTALEAAVQTLDNRASGPGSVTIT